MSRNSPEFEENVRRVRRWYGVMVVSSLAILLLAVWGFNRVSERTTSLARIQQENSLRVLVNMAMNAIQPVIKRFAAGQIDRDTALAEIRRIGKTLIYTDEFGKNYIFINQQDGLVLVRPFRPEDELRNMWWYQDARGHYAQQIVSRAVADKPDGVLVVYNFINPETGKEDTKLSWVKLVPELNIHVGPVPI